MNSEYDETVSASSLRRTQQEFQVENQRRKEVLENV